MKPMDYPALRQPLIETFLTKNQELNLSAIRTAEGVYHKHILDSIEANKLDIFWNIKSVIDIGTGGGFPLLALALTHPDIVFTGLDARRKKINAINDMIATLGITNAQGIRSRIEDHHQTYDMVTARAVTHMETLVDRAYGVCKPGGLLVAYKQYSNDEKYLLAASKKRQIVQEHRYKLLDEDIDRVIRVAKKL